MSTLHWNREPINRFRLTFQEVVFSKSLCTCNWPEEAAKLYMKYLEEHPEDKDIVKMKIDEHEEEDDYYGNGGGIRRRIVIYKTKEESEEDYKDRINRAEHVLEEQYDYYKKALEEDYLYFKNGKNECKFNID